MTPLTIPEQLYGTFAQARRKFRMICRRAVEAGNWESPLAGRCFVDLRQSDALITIDSAFIRPSSGTWFYPCVVREVVDECAGDVAYKPIISSADPELNRAARNAKYRIVRDLTLGGMDSFWMCLATLEPSAPWYLQCEAFESEKAALGASMLRKLLPWWGDLCTLHAQKRFDVALPHVWMSWGGNAVSWAIWMGMSAAEWRRLHDMPPEEAGKRMSDFLEQMGM